MKLIPIILRTDEAEKIHLALTRAIKVDPIKSDLIESDNIIMSKVLHNSDFEIHEDIKFYDECGIDEETLQMLCPCQQESED